MRVIPVIDLMNGQVVRGVQGRRSEYGPIVSEIAADAAPRTVASAFVRQFGFDTAYVADLDAIMQDRPDFEGWRNIASCGLKLWLDAGVGTPERAVALAERLQEFAIDATIVIGLESVPAPRCVFDIARTMAARFRRIQLAFSLDLHNGQPLTKIEMWKDRPPIDIAGWVIEAGVRRLIVLDLADVGAGQGTKTLNMCRQIHNESPQTELVAGGGVRDMDDLTRLAAAGIDAALVASALHDSRLSPEQVRGFA